LYRDRLADLNKGVLNPDIAGLHNSYWMTTFLFDPALGLTKEKMVPDLRAQGIDVRPFFYPLSSLPAFKDTPAAATARTRNKISYEISPSGINLPSALNLTPEDVDAVCAAIRKLA
jgi:perosamine synthetase